MSRTVKGIWSGVAVLATFGAVQLASGHDLTIGLATPGAPKEVAARGVKADRDAVVPVATGQTRTISIRLDRLPNTSVVVRIPLAQEARNSARDAPPPRLFMKAGERRPTVACEPMVSVLTEVAKQLQPGRCLT
jgi:hypothetical protein